MRLIWEKHMDLPKEEIKNRLHAYLMEKKYMRKKNDESILFTTMEKFRTGSSRYFIRKECCTLRDGFQ